MKEIALAAVSIVSSFLFIFCLVALGWYIVWKVFLSRFKFVRELLGGTAAENPPVNELRDGRSKGRKPRRD